MRAGIRHRQSPGDHPSALPDRLPAGCKQDQGGAGLAKRTAAKDAVAYPSLFPPVQKTYGLFTANAQLQRRRGWIAFVMRFFDNVRRTSLLLP